MIHYFGINSKTQGGAMNIFEIATIKEKQMEQLYRELAEKTKHIGIKRIMTMLADEEGKHTKIVEGMKKKIPEAEHTNLMIDAKTILLNIKEQKDLLNVYTDQVEIYRKVRDAEKESENLYLNEAAKTEDPALKKALFAFAKEEAQHYRLMDEIVSFVEKPEQWVESAEFSSLDQY